jgi:hypothetical protein
LGAQKISKGSVTMRSLVRPYPPRYIVRNLESSLEITTSVNVFKNSFLIVFAIFFSVFWVGFGAFSSYMIVEDITSDFPFTLPKIIYVLPVEWLLGSIFLAAVFIWRFTFKEIFVVSEQEIVVNQQSRIFSRSSRYLAEHISDLRASTSYWNKPIAFDYGARTMRFGQGLDEAEAKQIVARIQERFPRYSASKM